MNSIALVAESVKRHIAAVKPDMEMQKILNKLLHPLDDGVSQKEWGWKAEFNQEEIVDDFIAEMKSNPQRCA